MKIKIKFWVLTTAIVAFSSCVSDEDLYDPSKAADAKKKEYQEAFEKKFGKIAADQDWGFGASITSRASNVNETDNNSLTVAPAVIEKDEREKVTKWFQENKNPTSITINWSDFYVQQISKSSEYGSKMNKLSTVLANGSKDEIQRFNAGGGDKMFMQKSGTSGFCYHNSEDSKWHDKFTVQYIDGAYYVGFDFEGNGQNPNQQIPADGYYSDWIVKITPANYKNAKRIMAEDLGEIGDFDFNDVVFDAVILNDATVITLQAAGGILPLYVGSKDEENEVHNRFGVSTETMVNTQAGKHQEYPPVIFRLKRFSDINDIPVIVDNNGVEITLGAEQGIAPGKICVPNTTTDWSNERVSIAHDDSYPLFKEYVSNPEVEWWIK